ncbi:MAG TPA: SRPBCC domain-containing protein [Bryobacteraceae bacterium]|nr:SRPBCC domain-containing protein [Bryobacteraceae bacterium]
MSELTHLLERTIVIEAPRSLVFRYFTDSARWASWWGAGSTIDARPGGSVLIRYPNGVQVFGEVIEIEEPERVVFTYGYESGKPIPPGASQVTIRLEPAENGTRLRLTHAFADADIRDQHIAGWRFQLSIFANLVANELHAGAANIVDAWFAAWVIGDAAERVRSLEAIAAPHVRFRDRYASIDGHADLNDHIGAALRFMPGIRLERKGAVRHCQHVLLVDWVAKGPDGAERMSGVSVIALDAQGKITSVTGFAD